ncbi:dynein axonemal intermediate chain 7 isoform X2 [Denticeps clupeoides]|nr:protein CASC1 isoform X2 [Denticeps clupeoides]
MEAKQRRLELKDRERREDELNELRHLLEENHKAVTTWERDSREKARWERYMRCDGSPDPSAIREINTFISLWRDDPEVQANLVLTQCALAVRLINELQWHLSDNPEPREAHQYQETLLTLQNLIHTKHNQITEEILKYAKTHCDIKTGNMQTVVQDENITLCVWANLKKNPRLEAVQFEEVKLGFKLPKQLAVSDVAVRILHTRYDHLSHMSHQTEPDQGHRSNSMASQAELSVAGNEQTTEGAELDTDGEDGESSRQGREDVQSAWSEGEKAPLAMEASIVDLQQYTPLGGVFYFDLFHLPPQPKTVKSWVIREVVDTGLQTFLYLPEQHQSERSSSNTPEDNSSGFSQPVGVSMAIPDFITFLEDPQVARWDPIGLHWRTDLISEVSYSAADRTVSFKMDTFYAFTLLQDKYANMPFQSWELRPLGQDSALLTITAALIEVKIVVKGDQCMLQTEQSDGLMHILGKWMSVSSLKEAMVSTGVNIFVNEYSDKYVSINAKDPLLEHTVYEQIALVSSTIAFCWSQWNTQCGQEHLVLQVSEHLEEGPVPEKAWSLYLLGAQRSQRLQMNERSASFSPELPEGTEYHSTFLHMLQDGMSASAQARVRQSHYLYISTVQHLLCGTRVLTYS